MCAVRCALYTCIGVKVVLLCRSFFLLYLYGIFSVMLLEFVLLVFDVNVAVVVVVVVVFVLLSQSLFSFFA